MEIDPDICERVDADFSLADRPSVLEALSESSRNGRIIRCVLFAARGSAQRVRELLASADLDGRNVIVAGEYDHGRRVRDHRVSFHIDSPKHFWISNVAITAHKRGYRLTRLDTRNIVTPPHAGCEIAGTAEFTNGRRSIAVQNNRGQWSIADSECNLAEFGLDSPLTNEIRFRVQLDYMLSRLDA